MNLFWFWKKQPTESDIVRDLNENRAIQGARIAQLESHLAKIQESDWRDEEINSLRQSSERQLHNHWRLTGAMAAMAMGRLSGQEPADIEFLAVRNLRKAFEELQGLHASLEDEAAGLRERVSKLEQLCRDYGWGSLL